MLPDLLFPTALLPGSLLFLFYGLVMLLSADKYLPTAGWGKSTLELVRKRPIQFGKRVAGFCLTVAILWIFAVPAISWMVHLLSGHAAPASSSLNGTHWDLLALGIGAVLVGYFMFTWPKKWVQSLLALDKEKLQDVATRRIWTLYIQVAGLYFAVLSLMSFSDFVRSLR
jgi:hypothetical protein